MFLIPQSAPFRCGGGRRRVMEFAAGIRCAWCSAFLLSPSGPLLADTLHVSRQGDDQNPGTSEAPLRSLSALTARLRSDPKIAEVVLQAGTYRGSLSIPMPDGVDRAQVGPLLVRAAAGDSVTIHGARALESAETIRPVGGKNGVYEARPVTLFRTSAQAREGKHPRVWDKKARRRYRLVADRDAVEHFPGSYTLTDTALYLHTFDDAPLTPETVEVSLLDSAGDHGVELHRPLTTVRGLRAEGFFRDSVYGSGFMVRGNRCTLEDCRAENCPRGFTLQGEDATVRRCRAEDVGGGLRCGAARPVIEDCSFHKITDGFEVPIPPVQENSGVLLYYETAGSGTVRRNVVSGFQSGVFIKCHTGEFLVEANTFSEIRGSAVTGDQFVDRASRILCRRNVIYGSNGITIPLTGGVRLEADNNCLSPLPWDDPLVLSSNVKELRRYGKGNFLAAARIAAPRHNDFRLLGDSPCLPGKRVAEGIGALAAVDQNYRDSTPPVVRLADQPFLIALSEPTHFLSPGRYASLSIEAFDNIGKVESVRVRVDNEDWSKPLRLRGTHKVKLPESDDSLAIQVTATDDAGNTSLPATIQVRRGGRSPQLVGEPIVRKNPYGATIAFQTTVECVATGIYGETGEALRTRHYVSDESRYRYLGADTTETARRDHVLAFILPESHSGANVRYRIDLTTAEGKTVPVRAAAVRLTGTPREWHVAPDGRDDEIGGDRTKPLRSIQYAVDRALPGDEVLVAPGVYEGTTVIRHGGAAGAPLVVRSTTKWGAILDGNRSVRSVLSLVESSHVEIRDFEARWFSQDGNYGAIYAFRSPDVKVRGCRIWNAFWWQSRPQGRGLLAAYSPGFVAERNLIFKTDYAIRLYNSPRSRILHNTATGTSHGGIEIDQSAIDTVIEHNDLAFQGNDVFAITLSDRSRLTQFVSDHNNLGTSLPEWEPKPGTLPSVAHPDLPTHSKAITIVYVHGGTWESGVGGYPSAKWLPDATTPPTERGDPFLRLRTIEDWRAFSGHDQHSLFVDPSRADMPALRFELKSNSPLIGAGADGATIGAMSTVN